LFYFFILIIIIIVLFLCFDYYYYHFFFVCYYCLLFVLIIIYYYCSFFYFILVSPFPLPTQPPSSIPATPFFNPASLHYHQLATFFSSTSPFTNSTNQLPQPQQPLPCSLTLPTSCLQPLFQYPELLALELHCRVYYWWKWSCNSSSLEVQLP